jgi:hypothetical protein
MINCRRFDMGKKRRALSKAVDKESSKGFLNDPDTFKAGDEDCLVNSFLRGKASGVPGFTNASTAEDHWSED